MFGQRVSANTKSDLDVLKDKLYAEWRKNNTTPVEFNPAQCKEALQAYLQDKTAEYRASSSFAQFFSSYKYRKKFIDELELLLDGYLLRKQKDEKLTEAKEILFNKFSEGLSKFLPVCDGSSHRFFEMLYWHRCCLNEQQKACVNNNLSSGETKHLNC